jgi:hypothetical protein
MLAPLHPSIPYPYLILLNKKEENIYTRGGPNLTPKDNDQSETSQGDNLVNQASHGE